MKKRKNVSWDPSVNHSDEVMRTDEIEQSSRRKRQKLKGLESVYTEFDAEIDDHLKYLLVELLIDKLGCLNRQGKELLPLFMGYTNYRLFDWSLEHRNVLLATYLLKNLPRNTLIIMLNRDNYAVLRNFITCASKIADLKNNIDDDTALILASVMSIDNWEIKEVIRNAILGSPSLSGVADKKPHPKTNRHAYTTDTKENNSVENSRYRINPLPAKIESNSSETQDDERVLSQFS